MGISLSCPVEAAILGVILACVSLLAVEQDAYVADRRAGRNHDRESRTRDAAANACVAAFVAEFVVEVVARGAVLPAKTAYLRDPMNCLDTAVTALSLAYYAVPKGRRTPLVAARLLRLLRVVRPLKILARGSRSVHALLEALEFSRRALANVVAACAFTVAVFAVVGSRAAKG